MCKQRNVIFSALLAFTIAGSLCVAVFSRNADAQRPATENDLKSTADRNEKVHSRVFPSLAVGTIFDLLAKTKGDLIVTSPDDKEEGSVQNPDAPSYPPSRLVELACFADAVVIAAPLAGVSHLTADKTFVYSDWTMHVDEILQDVPKAPIDGKETITVVRPGGKLVIDGRTVYGKASYFPEFQPEDRYLLFLSYIPETGAFKARTERSFNLVLDKQRPRSLTRTPIFPA